MFNEDVSVFFNRKDFAVEAVIEGDTGCDKARIAGYLSRAYPTLADDAHSAGHYHFVCAANGMLSASLVIGEVVFIQNNRYHLVGIQWDGTGLATLVLRWVEGLSCR